MTKKIRTKNSDEINGHPNYIEFMHIGDPNKIYISMWVNFRHSRFSLSYENDGFVYCENQDVFQGSKKINDVEEIWNLVVNKLSKMVDEHGIKDSLTVCEMPDNLEKVLNDTRKGIKRHIFNYSYMVPDMVTDKSNTDDNSKTI